MRTLFFAALLFIAQASTASALDVPNRMQFADLDLTLTKGAQDYISNFTAKLKKSPTYFASLVDKANTYMPIVETAFQEAGAPQDLRFIVIQESALNGAAVSKSGAVGFWQFKVPAAKEVGLLIDKHVDERKHIYRSSYGAASYFARINRDFDNWIYAVIGYNRGPVGALSFVDEKKYGSKRLTVTQHTHWYALKALSYKLMFERELGKAAPKLNLEAHRTKGESSVAKLAKRHNLSEDEFRKHNLWIKGNRLPEGSDFMYYIPGKGSPVVKPPKEKPIAEVKPPVVKPAPKPAPRPKPTRNTRRYSYLTPETDPHYGVDYVVLQEGEQLVEVGVRHGKRLKKLRAYNDAVVGVRPAAGTLIYLRPREKMGFHIAAPGDSWASIAQLYDIDKKKLRKLNRVETLGPKIIPGQKVYLKKRKAKGEKVVVLEADVRAAEVKEEKKVVEKPVKKEAEKPAPKKVEPKKTNPKKPAPKGAKYHTVRTGETLWRISQKHGTSVDAIKRLNRLKGNEIFVGQKLRVR